MANEALLRMMNVGFPKWKLNPNPDESENASDFVFAKNCRNVTTFGFEFELHHIPNLFVCHVLVLPTTTELVVTILTAIFQLSLTWLFPFRSTCSGREPLRISCMGFSTGRMPFLSPNQQCQSTEGNSKALTPSICLTSSFFITIKLKEKAWLL